MHEHKIEGLIILGAALLTIIASYLDTQISLIVSVSFLVLFGIWKFFGR
jgi:hypothetical protein